MFHSGEFYSTKWFTYTFRFKLSLLNYRARIRSSWGSDSCVHSFVKHMTLDLHVLKLHRCMYVIVFSFLTLQLQEGGHYNTRAYNRTHSLMSTLRTSDSAGSWQRKTEPAPCNDSCRVAWGFSSYRCLWILLNLVITETHWIPKAAAYTCKGKFLLTNSGILTQAGPLFRVAEI